MLTLQDVLSQIDDYILKSRESVNSEGDQEVLSFAGAFSLKGPRYRATPPY